MKSSYKPQNRKRYRELFEHRYHMTRSEWIEKKKELRESGEGFKINELRQKVRV